MVNFLLERTVPLPLDEAPYRLRLDRPAVLAKKQAKAMEMLYYLPRKCTFTAPPLPGGIAGAFVGGGSI